MEQVTYYLKLVFTILGGAHPTRLSGGLLLGLVLKGGCDFGSRVYETNVFLEQAAATPLWFFMSLSILIFFLPVFFGRTKISENNAAFIELVAKVVDRSNLTRTEERVAWRTLLDKMLDAFRPEGETIVDTQKAIQEVVAPEDEGDG